MSAIPNSHFCSLQAELGLWIAKRCEHLILTVKEGHIIKPFYCAFTALLRKSLIIKWADEGNRNLVLVIASAPCPNTRGPSLEQCQRNLHESRMPPAAFMPNSSPSIPRNKAHFLNRGVRGHQNQSKSR